MSSGNRQRAHARSMHTRSMHTACRNALPRSPTRTVGRPPCAGRFLSGGEPFFLSTSGAHPLGLGDDEDDDDEDDDDEARVQPLQLMRAAGGGGEAVVSSAPRLLGCCSCVGCR
jgi:hypothetical protein